MRTDHYYPSKGAGLIHYCRWMPQEPPRAVVQIVHGIAEFAQRYEDFARFLNSQGYLVVAEDHMGHGQSIGKEGIQGYFHGGWFAAVEDTLQLMKDTMAEFPGIPYVLFGHSMGSFMARTILAKYPDSGISAAVICGTGWQPNPVLKLGKGMCRLVCSLGSEEKPNETLQGIVFGGYNKRVEHPRTPFDWLSRDTEIVDDYIAHPLCGFTASAGLLRDMLSGMEYIQTPRNLERMRKNLPVLFIAGGDDPVGNYGRGVQQAADAFRRAGMERVEVKLYPLGRHEILNEINKEEVCRDAARWMEKMTELK